MLPNSTLRNAFPVALLGLIGLFGFLGLALSPMEAWSQTPDAAPTSPATEECLGCHASIHPGIVEAWQASRHAAMTPAMGLKRPELERRVNGAVLDELREVSVGCAECHTARAEKHAGSFEHNGYQVHAAVSPDDCGLCHGEERRQFAANVMSHAHGNLAGNPVFGQLMQAINGSPHLKEGKLSFAEPEQATQDQACLSCHGTRLAVTGTATRETVQGEMDFPIIKGWPNRGVGRVNLDGSLGACSACHTRHAFSIKEARSPYTCKECHEGPDVPVYYVYAASAHGKIHTALGKDWNYEAVPWTVGKDFTAPTCAACHVSLLVDTEGSIVAKRTHRMNDRLAWRLFGLVYAHPHPLKPDTTIIRNSQGLPLPADLDGKFAANFLADAAERDRRAKAMQQSCTACHDSSWIKGHWDNFEHAVRETNERTARITDIMQEIWAKGLAQGPGKGPGQGGNLFDEHPERIWSDAWLFYANSIRYAAAMAGGGDYGVFEKGRYHLSRSASELHDWLELRQRLTNAKEP
ncbi:Cytochrome c554 and c-prime/Seven times multi-heme cytochrome CxxCH [Desulfocurvibacter africanus PCS]|uniref:Cytochrome c554 and c-prime/Seven times multi-heme cytochrome CxxCH n=1 Tax=Desulfocurvibacter africanus PCS TaxID=1262666 RepID=M5Q1W7_DESAF|nr:multiheme c-type cytochrome [Desulfocurvibacter africanus]EMG36918.1 Cytochrome c554 and c-prime/Seven times multi-heme cytochrome CxxCH [Desulfocurvibacter africanus PCS]